MNRTPLIRDGKMTGNPLEGGDLSRLDAEQAHKMNDILKRAQAGKTVTTSDVQTILKARSTIGVKVKEDDTLEVGLRSLQNALHALRSVQKASR